LIVRDEKGLLKPKDPEHLLDAWHEAYDFMRHRVIKGHVAARSGEELLHKIAGVLEKQALGYAATGLCAAWLYSHFANFRLTTFYLPNTPGNESATSGIAGGLKYVNRSKRLKNHVPPQRWRLFA